MKTAIIYESWHHGNTKKLCDAIKEKFNADLFDVKEGVGELEGYDLIGIASGIAYSKFYKEITQFVKDSFPKEKDVFLLYTCGKPSKDFAKEIKNILSDKKCTVKGTYCCKGLDTYGPFKLIGGLNKEHPTEAEIQGAVDFVEKIL